MTKEIKTLLSLEGTLFVDCRITTGNQQEIVTGQAYGKNIKKNFQNLKQRAILNAIHKYYYYLEVDGKRSNIDRQKFIPEEKDGLGQYESGRILDKKLNPILVVEIIRYYIKYGAYDREKDDYFINGKKFKIKRVKRNRKYYSQTFLIDDKGTKKFKEDKWTYTRLKEDYIDNTEIENIEKEQNQRKPVNIKKFRHKKPKI